MGRTMTVPARRSARKTVSDTERFADLSLEYASVFPAPFRNQGRSEVPPV